MNAIPHAVSPQPKARTREEVIAWDLAVGLDDMKAIPLYLSYAKRYRHAWRRRKYRHLP